MGKNAKLKRKRNLEDKAGLSLVKKPEEVKGDANEDGEIIKVDPNQPKRSPEEVKKLRYINSVKRRMKQETHADQKMLRTQQKESLDWNVITQGWCRVIYLEEFSQKVNYNITKPIKDSNGNLEGIDYKIKSKVENYSTPLIIYGFGEIQSGVLHLRVLYGEGDLPDLTHHTVPLSRCSDILWYANTEAFISDCSELESQRERYYESIDEQNKVKIEKNSENELMQKAMPLYTEYISKIYNEQYLPTFESLGFFQKLKGVKPLGYFEYKAECMKGEHTGVYTFQEYFDDFRSKYKVEEVPPTKTDSEEQQSNNDEQKSIEEMKEIAKEEKGFEDIHEDEVEEMEKQIDEQIETEDNVEEVEEVLEDVKTTEELSKQLDEVVEHEQNEEVTTAIKETIDEVKGAPEETIDANLTDDERNLLKEYFKTKGLTNEEDINDMLSDDEYVVSLKAEVLPGLLKVEKQKRLEELKRKTLGKD